MFWAQSGDGAGYVGPEDKGELGGYEEAGVAAVGVVGEELGGGDFDLDVAFWWGGDRSCP